jgi:hypothetical protein
LDGYLGEEMSLSYWSDEGIDVAGGLIAEFGPTDWDALTRCWRERPATWQERCVQTLEYGDLARGIPLLLEILVQGDDEVAQQAAYTLDMRRLQSIAIEAGPEVRTRLRELAAQRPADAPTNQALLKRITFGD